MSRTIDLQSAVNILSSGRVQQYDDLYFALVDKMAGMGIDPVRKPAIRPTGPAGTVNVRGLLQFIAGCGVTNSELPKERQDEIKAAETTALQTMRFILDQRYAISGHKPDRKDGEPLT